MAERQIRAHQQEREVHDEPYSDMRHRMVHMHHRQTLWIYWTLILLGVWTVLAPFTFGYLDATQWVDPSGGRGVWFSDQTHTELRARLMTWSDLISGVLLIIFGWRALKPNRPFSLWVCCFVGIWLSFAPLVFWAPTAGAYASDTMVGMLVIALTVLIPGMPNMILYMKMGPPTPAGWSYNPSSWPQRAIMIALGFLGLVVSRYLGVFQLGYIEWMWDPFFGGGSERVLNSDMSHMWPISDAALGATAYTFEFLMGFMGSPSRWRTMPWMVTFFGI
ncbi:MAG TPA: vitamin K epoxide reductase family protein, partial [Wenzhouxiangella sp.]|nr:vitamin K epoxide reductase family protein [Wenzhouxiangella sp.]